MFTPLGERCKKKRKKRRWCARLAETRRRELHSVLRRQEKKAGRVQDQKEVDVDDVELDNKGSAETETRGKWVDRMGN